MGEAKYRKANDPYYGKPKPTIKGIILSVPIETNGTEAFLKKTDLDDQDLRSTLLYWDRIAFPTSNIISIPGGQNVDYLASCGILQRRVYRFSGDGVQSLIAAQYTALAELEDESPGSWSLGAGDNSLVINDGATYPDKGSILKLYNALPVPREDTPLAEILNFKQKRRPELLALRSHIDTLSAEIASKNDSVDELNRTLGDLDTACSNLYKVTQEYQLPFYLSNMSASLNFEATKATGTAIGVWASTTSLGLGVTAATLASTVAAVATTIELKADIKLRSLKRDASPYKYVYLAQRDLF